MTDTRGAEVLVAAIAAHLDSDQLDQLLEAARQHPKADAGTLVRLLTQPLADPHQPREQNSV